MTVGQINLFKVIFSFQPVHHVLSHATAAESHRQLGVLSKDEETTRDSRLTSSELPTTMMLNDQLSKLTALKSPPDTAPGCHLTSKGGRRPRDYSQVTFTTESPASSKAPACCKHPVDVGGHWPASSRAVRAPTFPAGHSVVRLMRCADVSNPLTDRTSNNTAIVRHVDQLTTNKKLKRLLNQCVK